MKIIIHYKSVVIIMKNGTRFDMTRHQFNQLGKAFEIIRNMQNLADIETATIKIT